MLTTPGGSSAWRSTSQKSSAVSGVVSAGFSTTVFPAASAGAIFHASISSGKFHGMIWPRRRAASAAVRERVLELVGPARVVEEVRGRERQVDVARLLDRLAAVQRLEHGELARALREDARDPEQVLRALASRAASTSVANASRAAATASCDVRLARLRDLGERLLVARRDRREVLASPRPTRRRRRGRSAPAGSDDVGRLRARARTSSRPGRASGRWRFSSVSHS